MTLANAEQVKQTPWFAKAGAACSIVPISRFVGPSTFALKGGGYGCLFSLTGVDEEGRTDQEIDSLIRTVEGALRGLPDGSCLHQYTRVMSGFELPRQEHYVSEATEAFAADRLALLNKNARFRRIDLHWCLTLEPPKVKAFTRKPEENAHDSSRMLADLQKTAINLDLYDFAEDVAAFYAGDDENDQQTPEEILLATLTALPDDKLTQFALRLVLTGHTDTPRENDFDYLAQAAEVFDPPQAKVSKAKDKPAAKKPAIVQETGKKQPTKWAA